VASISYGDSKCRRRRPDPEPDPEPDPVPLRGRRGLPSSPASRRWRRRRRRRSAGVSSANPSPCIGLSAFPKYAPNNPAVASVSKGATSRRRRPLRPVSLRFCTCVEIKLRAPHAKTRRASVAASARWRGDSTPSTRRCRRDRVGSMAWRFTKVSAIILR